MPGRGLTQFHRVAAPLAGTNQHAREVLVAVRAEERGVGVEDDVHDECLAVAAPRAQRAGAQRLGNSGSSNATTALAFGAQTSDSHA